MRGRGERSRSNSFLVDGRAKGGERRDIYRGEVIVVAVHRMEKRKGSKRRVPVESRKNARRWESRRGGGVSLARACEFFMEKGVNPG